jgi:hypothetical protein
VFWETIVWAASSLGWLRRKVCPRSSKTPQFVLLIAQWWSKITGDNLLSRIIAVLSVSAKPVLSIWGGSAWRISSGRVRYSEGFPAYPRSPILGGFRVWHDGRTWNVPGTGIPYENPCGGGVGVSIAALNDQLALNWKHLVWATLFFYFSYE